MTPKFPALTARKVMEILVKKGYVLDRVKGSHHIYYHPTTKKRVVVPLRKAELPIGMLKEILRQAGIDKGELESLL
nr:type II toxin-antitoxin system HicA family toxin [Candidatus Sigynarchaeum springense]